MTITDAEVERLTDQQITDLLREASDSRDIRFRPFRHFFVMALRELQSSRAASQARALSSGEGWVLVPVEPTEAMADAYWAATGESEAMRGRTQSYARRYYRAMLAARPPSPSPFQG